jgi:hypothetical protein
LNFSETRTGAICIFRDHVLMPIQIARFAF